MLVTKVFVAWNICHSGPFSENTFTFFWRIP
jgi:hypothetical protein